MWAMSSATHMDRTLARALMSMMGQCVLVIV